jgi:DNA-directed RNA polymerase specialized sigma24 family protein
MDTLRRNALDGEGELTSADQIQASHARVVRACVAAGLRLSDAEDVAQDLFLWLIRDGATLAVVSAPWLAAVARNFIRRYWRGRIVRNLRESSATSEAEVFARSDDRAKAIEVRLSLDRVERRLPLVEARLLHLVRQGCSFAEAVGALGIPRGSRTFFRKRLIAYLAQDLRAPEAPRLGARAEDRPPK